MVPTAAPGLPERNEKKPRRTFHLFLTLLSRSEGKSEHAAGIFLSGLIAEATYGVVQAHGLRRRTPTTARTFGPSARATRALCVLSPNLKRDVPAPKFPDSQDSLRTKRFLNRYGERSGASVVVGDEGQDDQRPGQLAGVQEKPPAIITSQTYARSALRIAR